LSDAKYFTVSKFCSDSTARPCHTV
jgi:hypothetical protein